MLNPMLLDSLVIGIARRTLGCEWSSPPTVEVETPIAERQTERSAGCEAQERTAPSSRSNR